MSRNRAGLAVLTLSFLLLLAGCGGGNRQAEETRYVVGVVTKSGSSEYWMSIRRGMETAADEAGLGPGVFSPDSQGRGGI